MTNTEELHIMIGTPCYGGLVYESYLRGVTGLVAHLSSLGLPINISTVVNESLITRARNEIVKNFIMSDCTHLFFIDADISFRPEDVLQIVSHNKDIVTAAYPLKGIRWENLGDMSNVNDIDEVRRRVTEYVVNFEFESEEDLKKGRLSVVEGLIAVRDAGTGFMCIKRNVIEKIIEANPDIGYRKESKYLINDKDDGSRWAVFDTEIEDGWRYLSEDYLFCRRWQRLGGTVWLDPTIILNHTGSYQFQGRKFFQTESEMQQAPIKNNKLIGG